MQVHRAGHQRGKGLARLALLARSKVIHHLGSEGCAARRVGMRTPASPACGGCAPSAWRPPHPAARQLRLPAQLRPLRSAGTAQIRTWSSPPARTRRPAPRVRPRCRLAGWGGRSASGRRVVTPGQRSAEVQVRIDCAKARTPLTTRSASQAACRWNQTSTPGGKERKDAAEGARAGAILGSVK